MKTDKSNILLKQYAYETYKYININDLNSLVKCVGLKKQKNTRFTKHDLFFEIYGLGKNLFNELEGLEINISIKGVFDGKVKNREQSIKNLLRKKEKIEDYAEVIEDEFFKNIIEKINSSKTAQDLILNWYDKYGVPNLYDEMIYTYITKDINTGKIEAEKIVPQIFKSNCLELINFSLLIYIIYSINNIIKQANETKQFKKLISVFPGLFEEYQENGFDLENNNLFMKYLLEIIRKVNRGIDNFFFDFVNYETYSYDIENEFPTSLEELENEDKNYKIELLKVATIIKSPISFAWRYLLKLLTIDDYEDGYYWCENCNEILSTNTVLCYSCKESLGNMYLNDHNINLTLKEEIKKELEDKNYFNTKYPKGPIVHRYQNIRKNVKYNKKRKKKK